MHNFYVPAGGDIPESRLNQKFAHKLQFLQETPRMGRATQGFVGRLRSFSATSTSRHWSTTSGATSSSSTW